MVEVKERPKTRGEHAAANTIRKVGIIGAGQMGSGIAHVCALSGFDVLLNDVAADRISAGLATISGNLARQVSRQRITDEQRQAAIKRIGAAPTLGDLSDCDLVIEAATEKEDTKRASTARSARRSSATPSSAPAHPRSRSRGLPRRPTGRSASSASTS